MGFVWSAGPAWSGGPVPGLGPGRLTVFLLTLLVLLPLL